MAATGYWPLLSPKTSLWLNNIFQKTPDLTLKAAKEADPATSFANLPAFSCNLSFPIYGQWHPE